MVAKTSLVLIPGLLCSPALWAAQIRTLSDIAAITVADHTGHASMREIATAILAAAPARFAVAGLSMGGYVACEIMRQAADRVTRLALLDTGVRADAPERRAEPLTSHRLGRAGRGGQGAAGIVAASPSRGSPGRTKPLVDTVLQMAIDTGVAAFKRQQTAIMTRPDNRALLSHDQLPEPGPGRPRRRADAAGDGTGNRRRHSRLAARDHRRLRPPLPPWSNRRGQPSDARLAPRLGTPPPRPASPRPAVFLTTPGRAAARLRKGRDNRYSSCSHRASAPPITPPMMGATQNSHNWLSAVAPPNTALPRLRAGLTEALEIGIAIR